MKRFGSSSPTYLVREAGEENREYSSYQFKRTTEDVSPGGYNLTHKKHPEKGLCDDDPHSILPSSCNTGYDNTEVTGTVAFICT